MNTRNFLLLRNKEPEWKYLRDYTSFFLSTSVKKSRVPKWKNNGKVDTFW